MQGPISVLKSLANHVMRVLGKGHRESVYHKALVTGLNRRNTPHRSEVICPIEFMGQIVGFGKADIILDDLVIEIKANTSPPSEVTPQLQKYLESMRKSEKKIYRGLIINFNKKTGEVEFLEETLKPKSSQLFKRSLEKTVETPVPPMVANKRARR